MRTTAIIALLLLVGVSGCSSRSPKPEAVEFDIDLQRREISNRSITACSLHPVLSISNSTSDTLFVVLPIGPPNVIVNDSNRTIELDYSVEELPQEIMYYEFPYPTIIQVLPQARTVVYLQVPAIGRLLRLSPGSWLVHARVGCLRHSGDFLGHVDHGLRDQIVSRQSILKSKAKDIRLLSQ